MSGLISHEHRYIFMHIPKTGGTSLYKVLPYDEEFEHETAGWIRNKYPEEWKQYFKFTIIRNPYTRLISLYNWSLKNFADLKDNDEHKKPKIYDYIKDMPFCYYCFEVLNFVQGGYTGHFPQFYWFDWDKEIIRDFDYIGRFEKYEDEVRKICKFVDMDDINLPHTIKTVDNDLTDDEKIEKYYKYREQIKTTNYFYDLDFQNFNYNKINEEHINKNHQYKPKADPCPNG